MTERSATPGSSIAEEIPSNHGFLYLVQVLVPAAIPPGLAGNFLALQDTSGCMAQPRTPPDIEISGRYPVRAPLIAARTGPRQDFRPGRGGR